MRTVGRTQSVPKAEETKPAAQTETKQDGETKSSTTAKKRQPKKFD